MVWLHVKTRFGGFFGFQQKINLNIGMELARSAFNVLTISFFRYTVYLYSICIRG
nr:MAG TPA: hypothetical protein [Caudoviricetes sp.]